MSTMAHEISGDGVPVVFLHGLTFDRSSWRPITQRVGDRVLSVAFDLPAHGESAGSPMPLDELAALLHGELDALGVERPVVVGHSMSGGLAMTYAATQPVRGVVTVDAAPYVRPFGRLLRELEPALRGDAFAETFARVFQPTLGLELLPAAMMPAQRIRQEVVLGYWEELLQTHPDMLQARIDGLINTIEAPVLGVFGRALEPADRVRLARVRAEVEEWPGRGHFVHLAERDRFAERLLAFAARCELGGDGLRERLLDRA